MDDPLYSTPSGTALVVNTSGNTLLDNDWDPEGSALSASLVSSPSNGSLSNFSQELNIDLQTGMNQLGNTVQMLSEVNKSFASDSAAIIRDV